MDWEQAYDGERRKEVVLAAKTLNDTYRPKKTALKSQVIFHHTKNKRFYSNKLFIYPAKAFSS